MKNWCLLNLTAASWFCRISWGSSEALFCTSQAVVWNSDRCDCHQ